MHMLAGLQKEAGPVVQDLKADLIERCENGEYADKTIMFCWEHKNIPYIVAKLGLAKKDLTWGLNPERGVRLSSLVPAMRPVVCLAVILHSEHWLCSRRRPLRTQCSA